LRISPIKSLLKLAHGSQLATVQSAWREKFFGDAFDQVVTAAEKSFDPFSNHSRFMPIVQSSGMENSRLIDQYATKIFDIVFTLRLDEQTGYPPGDIEITDLLHSETADRDVHTVFAALLVGAVERGESSSRSSSNRNQLPRSQLSAQFRRPPTRQR
jgi:hypothetical protein